MTVMNFNDAKEYILNNYDQVLEPDNASKNKSKSARGYGYICPICNSGAGKNGTGIQTKDRRHFSCFGKGNCFTNSDLIDILAIKDGLQSEPFIRKLQNACRYFNITLDNTKNTLSLEGKKSEKAPEQSAKKEEQTAVNYFDFYREKNSHLSECDYLTKRGISKETQEKFLIGYDKGRHQIIIPLSANAYKARNLDENMPNRYQMSKGANQTLFNDNALNSDIVIAVEGEIDALSLIDLGFNVIGLGSVGNSERLVNLIAERKFDGHLILALDNDSAGEIATDKIIKGLKLKESKGLLSDNPPLVTRSNVSELYLGCKDANEALLKDREQLRQNIEGIYKSKLQIETERYTKENGATPILEDFLKDILEQRNPAPTATGFKNLDTILDGGFFNGGLYIIGAISSLGKTTLTMQIADNVAKGGNDVLIFSLEMSKKELIAKSVSRITMQELDLKNGADIYKARTVRDLTANVGKNTAEGYKLISKAMKEYKSFSDNVFILEGMGDINVIAIRKTVEKHIRCRGKKPFVIVDYLQILEPYNQYTSDKQNTDKAVLELKRLSRDLDLPVLAVSSFNRENYDKPLSMSAFKESGAIEYGCDVLMGLGLKGAGENGFDVDKAKSETPRRIELKILKNRNGITGKTIELFYYPMFNCFEEK